MIIRMLLAALVLPLVAHAGDYKPRLFKSMELVYEDQFDKDGPFNPKQWVVRQETRWEVKDGILVGSSSTKEYQQKMIAKGDSHTGIIPVIFLKPVPAEFVVQMRVRYDGQYTGTKIPLLDLGHHHNSLYFGKDKTKLFLHKRNTVYLDDLLLPGNKWVDLTVELKKGTIFLQIDKRKETIKHGAIDMKESLQIDFKGMENGNIKIDWIKLYKGIN